jgi:Outer membrane cytochrome MtrC/MtrF-like, domains II/IV/Cytochrome c7 and related cytochrome c
MLKRVSSVGAFAFLVLALGTAHAAALTNQACLDCHNVTPTAAQEAEPVSLYVNAKVFKSSVHAPLGCTSCHSDVKAFPHVPKPQMVACGKCHGGPATDFAQSIHASKWNLRSLKFPACLNCHGNPHTIQADTNPRSPVYQLNLPHTCGRCHGNPALAKQYGLPNVYALYIDSIHAFALSREGLLVAATCSSCHGAHRILSTTDPHSSTYRSNVPATCGSCHAGVEARYFAGVHGKALKAGNATAPVCTTCHTVHSIVEVQTVKWQLRTVATCGNCHKARLRSYRDTFHGQVTALGFVATARCWSCHRNHEILPPSDPRSSIAPRNLPATCGKCHGHVSKSFVTYEPHPDPHNRALNPALYYAKWFMNLLLLFVFVSFGLHTLLWLVRSRMARRRR